MSTKRTKIVTALAEKFKTTLDGTSPYKTNLFGNSSARLKFWDEVTDFPSVFVTPGSETREYLPGDFTWGYLGVSIKAYVKSDEPQPLLEELLEDLERCIDENRVLIYDQDLGLETTEILVTSITTDEGLLQPYGVGEINLQVRYALS